MSVTTPSMRSLERDSRDIEEIYLAKLAAVDQELPQIERELARLEASHHQQWGDHDYDRRRIDQRLAYEAYIAHEYGPLHGRLTARKRELDELRAVFDRERVTRLRSLVESRPFGPAIPIEPLNLPAFENDAALQKLRSRRQERILVIDERRRRIEQIEVILEHDRADALDVDHRQGLGLATAEEREAATSRFERTRAALNREREAQSGDEQGVAAIDLEIAEREEEVHRRRQQQIARELPRAAADAADAVYHALRTMTRLQRLVKESDTSVPYPVMGTLVADDARSDARWFLEVALEQGWKPKN